MRLIDADELKDTISDTWILDRIDEQPTIDAVEVVRCKDCIHAKEMTQYGCGECVRHCEKLKIVTSPGWFCAEGRKSEQADS